MQLTTLIIVFSSFFNIQKVLGAPVPQFDFDVGAVTEVFEELDFIEDEQIGLENAVQRTGSAGGTINNLNAGKNKNHSTIIEVEDEEDEVGDVVFVGEEELAEEVEETETITETDVMDIEVEVDEPEVKYPEGYRHRHRHGRHPHH